MDERQIAAFLNGDVEFLSFHRLLEDAYEGEEPLNERLVERLVSYGSGKDREGCARKVRNWMHDRNLPKNREELFKICFALDLSLERAERILGTSAENGIHYRNPKELIYAFALKNHLDYPKARELLKLWDGPLPEKTLDWLKQAEETSLSETRSKLTGSIRSEWKRVKTEEELAEFLTAYKEDFGCHHNTAYRKFQKMLNCLLYPDSFGIPPYEKEYSVERVVEEYLRMGIPYDKKSRGYSRIQKEIKSHWPSAKTINEMARRKADVDRKTLLLLYLATEGMNVEEKGNCEQWFREHQKRINLMMTECGMAVLNPHAPFDYLIIQAIHKEHDDEAMSLRMEWMLGRLFSKKHPAAYIKEKGRRT